MHNYSKIQSVFKREAGSKRVNFYEWIDSYSFLLKDINWVGTEKVDGTNCNIYYDGNNIQILGHTDKTQWNPEVFDWLLDKFTSYSFCQFLEQTFGDKEIYLHGELIGPKIQSNLYNLNDYKFILFDISKERKVFYCREFCENFVKSLNVDFVDIAPVLIKGTIKECIDFLVNNRLDNNYNLMPERENTNQIWSAFNENREIEGIVIRPEFELYDNNYDRLIYKLKIKDLLGIAPKSKNN